MNNLQCNTIMAADDISCFEDYTRQRCGKFGVRTGFTDSLKVDTDNPVLNSLNNTKTQLQISITNPTLTRLKIVHVLICNQKGAVW